MSLVYVADDEPDLTALLKEALEDAGHSVVAAPDGATLLANVAREKPDLILLDINMPGLTGWDVRRKLLEGPETADIPVIAVTAQGGSSVETSATQTLKFTAFVRKPFNLLDLLGKVDDALTDA